MCLYLRASSARSIFVHLLQHGCVLFHETFRDTHQQEIVRESILFPPSLWNAVIYGLELQLFGCLCSILVFLIRISSSHGQYPVFHCILHNWTKSTTVESMGEVTWSGGWDFLCPDTYPLAKRKLVYNPRKSRRTVGSLREDTFPPMFLCLVSDRF